MGFVVEDELNPLIVEEGFSVVGPCENEVKQINIHYLVECKDVTQG